MCWDRKKFWNIKFQLNIVGHDGAESDECSFSTALGYIMLFLIRAVRVEVCSKFPPFLIFRILGMREKRLDVIYLQQLFHGTTIKNFCHVKLIKVNISYILLFSLTHFVKVHSFLETGMSEVLRSHEFSPLRRIFELISFTWWAFDAILM